MGLRGPTKTPDAVKERRGSRRVEDMPDAPRPEEANLEPPEWLQGVALELWNELAPELAELGVVKSTDRLMLAMLCRSYFEYRSAISPTAALEWMRQVTRIAKEFGLTPVSRSNVTATPKPKGETVHRRFTLVG